MSDSNKDDTIVKNLYEDLSNLYIENISEEKDNSSIDTVIPTTKKKMIPKPQHHVLPS